MKMKKAIQILGLAAVITLGLADKANALEVEMHADRDDFHMLQHIRNAPAVPEADTWAMMALGLGLVGLRLRRKSNKSSKK